MYRTSFENLDQLLSFVEIGVYVKNFEEYTKYTVHDLSTEITQKFPKTLYSAEDWNLKKVIAVQVHHTRMANGFIFETCDGKRIVFSGDTMPCKLLAELGKDADLLIHEATFGDDYEVCLLVFFLKNLFRLMRNSKNTAQLVKLWISRKK
jgi:hypothetical protein